MVENIAIWSQFSTFPLKSYKIISKKIPLNIIISLILSQKFDYYMLLFQHATLKIKGKKIYLYPFGIIDFCFPRSLFSSVVEHWSRKPGVVSSNLTGGKYFYVHSTEIGFYVISCLRRFFYQNLILQRYTIFLTKATKALKILAAGRIRTCAGKPHWISSPTP